MPVTTFPVSYTSVGLINSAFPPISSITAISSAVVAQFAGGVEAEMNSKLGKRYSLPFTVECPLLTAIATREAIYRIVVQRALIQFPPAHQGRHPLQIQHSDDQKLLDAIANGQVSLIDSSGQNIDESLNGAAEIYSTTMNYHPTMHEADVENMVQDENKIDDILQDRDLP